MSEQKLIDAAMEIRDSIKMGLLKKHISQVQIGKMIGEGEAQVSRAVNGDMSPKSVAIRQKIYEIIE